jgi:hypothetical protein
MNKIPHGIQKNGIIPTKQKIENKNHKTTYAKALVVIVAL